MRRSLRALLAHAINPWGVLLGVLLSGVGAELITQSHVPGVVSYLLGWGTAGFMLWACLPRLDQRGDSPAKKAKG